jgi:hypothetical protein
MIIILRMENSFCKKYRDSTTFPLTKGAAQYTPAAIAAQLPRNGILTPRAADVPRRDDTRAS